MRILTGQKNSSHFEIYTSSMSMKSKGDKMSSMYRDETRLNSRGMNSMKVGPYKSSVQNQGPPEKGVHDGVTTPATFVLSTYKLGGRSRSHSLTLWRSIYRRLMYLAEGCMLVCDEGTFVFSNGNEHHTKLQIQPRVASPSTMISWISVYSARTYS